MIHRLAERMWLKEFVRFAKGNPTLSWWEAGFIQSIDVIARSENGPLPSAKQAVVIMKLVKKLNYDDDGNAPVDAVANEDENFLGD